ncbi:putative DNA-binding transcriptional regulator YafY [Marinilabilia salmonicolor]|uniref:Putative DNA-binding transcriptional regulator YafY n=2 Tax=Marinilabilia salmonicolor TaxID=989 RepID=A0A368UVF0_9BACT|nr:putative DNA-binding transcriptional regulator YafY [Marinilabilia salmonicolor]
MLLSNGIRYPKEEIMDRFDLPARSFDRYIKTLRDAGFIIPPPGNRGYRIDKESPYFKDLSELLHFSREEAHILYSAIHSINNENLLKQNLIRKLYSLYQSDNIARTIVRQQQSTIIHDLTKAIKSGSKVILHGYSSANSNKQNDRLVEPFSFTTNYLSTWAYDIDAGCCKTFKNTRISSVQILNESWEFEGLHKEGFMDVFRISTDRKIPVKLKLTLRGCELLKEEYPLAENHISTTGNNLFIFEAPICSFEGVGRFILGLCHEVEILEPPELKDFIKKRMKKFLDRQ